MDMFVYKGITFCNSCHMFSACVYLKCPYISYVGIQYIYFHSVCILDFILFSQSKSSHDRAGIDQTLTFTVDIVTRIEAGNCETETSIMYRRYNISTAKSASQRAWLHVINTVMPCGAAVVMCGRLRTALHHDPRPLQVVGRPLLFSQIRALSLSRAVRSHLVRAFKTLSSRREKKQVAPVTSDVASVYLTRILSFIKTELF